MEDKLQLAIEIATQYHKGQMRKNGLPYISHPIAVMDILKEYHFPEEALIAAVLHDTWEDTHFSNQDLNKTFWHRVGFIVNALSKNKKPKDIQKLKQEFHQETNNRICSFQEYTNLDEYIDYRFHLYINRLYLGIIAEPRIFFIKIADQVHNLWDMEWFNTQKAQRKINEVEHYFFPIYRRLEDIFKITPQVHNDYKTFIKLLETALLNAKNKIK